MNQIVLLAVVALAMRHRLDFGLLGWLWWVILETLIVGDRCGLFEGHVGKVKAHIRYRKLFDELHSPKNYL